MKCDTKQPVAIVTGVGGMDGSILTEKLLAKGYYVIGVDMWRAEGLSPNMEEFVHDKNFKFVTGDIVENEFMTRLIRDNKPDYVYNLAAISLVPESFKIPQRIFNVNTMAVINMLEAIRTYSPETHFYQASTSEQIGDNTDPLQNTESKMLPNSTYAIAKLASYHLVRSYRSAFGVIASNGMLWNHEGTRRGPTFVTRKVSLHVGQTPDEVLQIGNLNAYRDWGLADDFCDAMIMINEAPFGEDYAINTGESHSIRELLEEAYSNINIKLIWKGEGADEKGYDQFGALRVEVNKDFYRPVEVPYLNGDHSKATKLIGWKPKTKFKELVKLMVEHDKKGNPRWGE